MAKTGKAVTPMTNAAIWAERYTRLKAGHAKWRAARRERADALARELAEAPLDEVVKHIRPRTWINGVPPDSSQVCGCAPRSSRN